MLKFYRTFITVCQPFFIFIASTFVILSLQSCVGTSLKPWHTEKLTEEFTYKNIDEVTTFTDYLQLEERLFKQLDQKIYAQNSTAGLNQQLERFSTGSAADFHNKNPDWNRSFEFKTEKPLGAVLLLHGMSDSPYSLRTLGQALNQHGYWVIGLRLPGHGTAPSGLRFIDRRDMAAAVRLAISHLANQVPNKPIHIVGYSTGASLALEYTLDSLEGKSNPVPAKLILISPAIGIHPSAALAGFKNTLSNVPGFDSLAYLQIQPEFDPYKYNSFATNAGDIVHRLTRSVARRIQERARTNPEMLLPPTLVVKSTVDATVTNEALLDNLFKHVKQKQHELVLFDINRFEVVKAKLLIDDPAPFTDRIMQDKSLPFTVTLITNEHSKTTQVVRKTKAPFSDRSIKNQTLELFWPPGVISLSHVALPISPSDPLYGQRPPENNDFLFLGQMALQGERGLLKIPADWMLRLRYNPFYDFLENRSLEWLEK